MKPEERTCDICQKDVIEDEIHFICECSVYSDRRVKLFNEISNKDPNFTQLSNPEKYVYLMKNEMKQISLFIMEIWNVRTDIQYK